MILFKFIGFLLGLAVGSFINVVLVRYPKRQTVVSGRSQCPTCGQKLGLFELIPLVSFIWLKGRCKRCRAKISWQYPAVEVIAGLGFLGIASLPLAIILKFWLAGFFALSLLIAAYDIKHLIIPDSFLVVLAGWVVGGNIFFLRDTIEIGTHLLSALALVAFFFVLFAVSSGKWLGGGDVKLAFILGFLVGWPGIFTLFFFTYMVGAVVAGTMLLFRKATLRSPIPFGPFLLIGSMISFLWSEQILAWYFNLL